MMKKIFLFLTLLVSNAAFGGVGVDLVTLATMKPPHERTPAEQEAYRQWQADQNQEAFKAAWQTAGIRERTRKAEESRQEAQKYLTNEAARKELAEAMKSLFPHAERAITSTNARHSGHYSCPETLLARGIKNPVETLAKFRETANHEAQRALLAADDANLAILDGLETQGLNIKNNQREEMAIRSDIAQKMKNTFPHMSDADIDNYCDKLHLYEMKASLRDAQTKSHIKEILTHPTCFRESDIARSLIDKAQQVENDYLKAEQQKAQSWSNNKFTHPYTIALAGTGISVVAFAKYYADEHASWKKEREEAIAQNKTFPLFSQYFWKRFTATFKLSKALGVAGALGAAYGTYKVVSAK